MRNRVRLFALWAPVLAAAGGVLGLCALAVQGDSPGGGELASFTAATDPSTVVLYVGVSSPRSRTARSMTVYGNGNVELRKTQLARVEEAYDIVLEPSERDRLLRLAVDYGLAEWDDTSIEARMARRLGTGRFLPSDAAEVRIMLAFTSYTNGDVSRTDLRKDIRFAAVETGLEIAPDIHELEGLKMLASELHRLWDQANGENEP